MQLQQRIITSLPIEKIDLRPPPLFARAKELPPEPQIHYNESYDFRPNEYTSVPPPSTCPPFSPGEYSTIYARKAPFRHPNGYMIESPSSAGFIERQEQESASPSNRQNTTNGYAMHSQQQALPIRCNEHSSNNGHSPTPSDDSWRTPLLGANSPINNGKGEKNEKSHFPSVKNLSLFGKKTRATSTDATKHDGSHSLHTQASALPKRLLSTPSPEHTYVAIPSRKASAPLPSTPTSYTGSRFSSISASTMTTQSSYEASEAPDFNPWAEQERNSTPDNRGKSKGSSSAQTLRSSGSIPRAPGSSLSVISNPKDLLPSEANSKCILRLSLYITSYRRALALAGFEQSAETVAQNSLSILTILSESAMPDLSLRLLRKIILTSVPTQITQDSAKAPGKW